jgi:exopolysaccharide biosynthesis polyprenyl glycosylphosphotransferase
VSVHSSPHLAAKAELTSAAGRERQPLAARRVLHHMFAAADSSAAAVAGAAGGAVGGLAPVRVLAFAAAGAVLWPFLLRLGGLYAHDDPPSWPAGVLEARRVALLALVFSWPLVAVAAAFGADHPIATAAMGAVLVALLTATGRGAARTVAHHRTSLRQRALVVGSGAVAGQLVARLQAQPELGLDPIGFVDDDPHDPDLARLPFLGSRDTLGAILAGGGVDRVIIAFSRASHEELLECMRICWASGVAIDVIPRLFELLDGARRIDRVAGMPVMAIDATSLSKLDRAVKRAVDIAVSGLLLTVLAPLLLVVAAAIKLTSRGSVLFSQARAGRNGTPFSLLKFRSMRTGSDSLKEELASVNDNADGVMFKMHADPRVTPVGRWLRRASIDELPQLVNVLRGDMSLVGPRPLVLSEFGAIGEGWAARRSEMRPGITGPWQVYGRSQLPFGEMLRFDYQYAAGWSLGRDVEILLATVPAVLSGRGAY